MIGKCRVSTLIESCSLAGHSDTAYYPAIDQSEIVVFVAQEHAGIYRFRMKWNCTYLIRAMIS